MTTTIIGPGNRTLTVGCVRGLSEHRSAYVALAFMCRSPQCCGGMDTNICAHCGGAFTPTRPERIATQRFCGQPCASRGSAHQRGRRVPWQERFWRHVPELRTDGCWVWQGHKDKAGYGLLEYQWRPKRYKQAHRASWEVHNGPIPEGLKVCHKCDNRPCVNPAHLFLGTQLDNIADMVSKGRHRAPTKIPRDVIDEVIRLGAEGLSHRVISERTGVSRSHVGYVVNRARRVSS